MDVTFEENEQKWSNWMGDMVVPGTTDHAKLKNRDAADQHPIEAITGLREALDETATINTPFVVTITKSRDEDYNEVTEIDHTYEEVLAEIKKGTFVIAKMEYVDPNDEEIPRYYIASTQMFSKMLGGNAIVFYSASDRCANYAGWWCALDFVGLTEEDKVKTGSYELPQFAENIMNIDGMHAKSGLLKGYNCRVSFAGTSDYVSPKALRISLNESSDGNRYAFTSMDWEDEVLPYLQAGGYTFATLDDNNRNPNYTLKVFLPVRHALFFDSSVKDDDLVVQYARISDDCTKIEYVAVRGDQTWEYSETAFGGGTGLSAEQEAALNANTTARHTHDNKSVLDSITADKLMSPLGITGATVGQVPQVASVDADGKPLTWDTVTMSAGSGSNVQWHTIADMVLEEQVNDIQISTDAESNSVESYNPLAMMVSFQIPADSTQTSTNGSVWVYPTLNMNNNVRAMLAVSNWKSITRTMNEIVFATEKGICWAGYSAIGSGDLFDTPSITQITACRLLISSSTDHFPAGTRIFVSVLGVKP